MRLQKGKIGSFLMEDSSLASSPELENYLKVVHARTAYVAKARVKARQEKHSRLLTSLDWHLYYGLHRLVTRENKRAKVKWIFREWLPNATEVWLVGEFSGWQLKDAYRLKPSASYPGDWEGIFRPFSFRHGQAYRLFVRWPGGEGYRIPSQAMVVRRDLEDISRSDVNFNAIVWAPQKDYQWKAETPAAPQAPLIYEAHIGMALDELRIGTFREFQTQILPRIVRDGYNTLQLMAVMMHPYYASFGYQVTNFFAIFDEFGTPDDFKSLVDAAHASGLRVTMDLIHSHAAPNEVEGLSCMDGTLWQYFHAGDRGRHPAWGSRCFDYSKPQVLRFLLSNCRFWLEEYHLDGFRFDGVTSMLYLDHGLGHGSWSYGDYFSANVDWDAFAYLVLANEVIHKLRPDATCTAEEVSGFPGLTVSPADGGCGFDYRLAMGVTDCWFKLTDIADQAWNLGWLWSELTAHRKEEKCISYVECHDQAMVGGKTFAFTLMDKNMYYSMRKIDSNESVSRGIALHKMARLVTLASANAGYLNFMGNEFGHPDWIDFPREDNHWSFLYARRMWRLVDNRSLKFHYLADFDQAMLRILSDKKQFFSQNPILLQVDNELKLLFFERNGFLFLFNFDPTRSYADLRVPCMPGSYRLALDSDAPAFGGFGRVAQEQVFFTETIIENSERKSFLQVYLPCRTALVLKKQTEVPAVAQPQ